LQPASQDLTIHATDLVTYRQQSRRSDPFGPSSRCSDTRRRWTVLA